jgi:hypothetical protein
VEALTTTDAHWAYTGWEAVVFALISLAGGIGTFAGILIHARHARRRAQREYEDFLAHPTRGPR